MNDMLTGDDGFIVSDDTADLTSQAEPPAPTRRKRRTKAEMEAAEMGQTNGNAPEAAERTDPKRRKTKAGTKDRETVWAQQIAGIYALGAVMTNAPFMAISDAEAKQLAHAGVAVAEEFGLFEFEEAGKYAAVAGLAAALLVVNVPRAFMFRQHLAAIRQTRQVAGANNGPVPQQPVNNAPGTSGPDHHVWDNMPKVDPTPLPL